MSYEDKEKKRAKDDIMIIIIIIKASGREKARAIPLEVEEKKSLLRTQRQGVNSRAKARPELLACPEPARHELLSISTGLWDQPVRGVSDRAAAASGPGPASNMASVAKMQRMQSLTTGVWGPGSLLDRFPRG